MTNQLRSVRPDQKVTYSNMDDDMMPDQTPADETDDSTPKDDAATPGDKEESEEM